MHPKRTSYVVPLTAAFIAASLLAKPASASEPTPDTDEECEASDNCVIVYPKKDKNGDTGRQTTWYVPSKYERSMTTPAFNKPMAEKAGSLTEAQDCRKQLDEFAFQASEVYRAIGGKGPEESAPCDSLCLKRSALRDQFQAAALEACEGLMPNAEDMVQQLNASIVPGPN